MQREFTTDNAEEMCSAMCDNETPYVSRETLSELARASVDFITAYNELLNADNPKTLLAYEQECEEKLASVIYAKLREIREVNKNERR